MDCSTGMTTAQLVEHLGNIVLGSAMFAVLFYFLYLAWKQRQV